MARVAPTEDGPHESHPLNKIVPITTDIPRRTLFSGIEETKDSAMENNPSLPALTEKPSQAALAPVRAMGSQVQLVHPQLAVQNRLPPTAAMHPPPLLPQWAQYIEASESTFLGLAKELIRKLQAEDDNLSKDTGETSAAALAKAEKDKENMQTIALEIFGLTNAEDGNEALSKLQLKDEAVCAKAEFLACFGSITALWCFAYLISRCGAEPNNKTFLLQDPQGLNLLNKLIWLSSWDSKRSKGHKPTAKTAREALGLIGADLNQLLKDMLPPSALGTDSVSLTHGVAVLEFVAETLFKATQCKSDESSRHIFFTVESEHPYSNGDSMKRYICIPGADKIVVEFDKLSATETSHDLISFHRSSECSDKDAYQKKILRPKHMFNGKL